MSEKRRDHKGRILRTGESQRKDLTYMYRFTDASKKRHTIYANSLDELRKKEAQLQFQQKLGITFDAEKYTVNEIISAYINMKKSKVRPRTIAQYTTWSHIVQNEPLGSVIATTVKVSMVKAFVLKLEEDGYTYGTIRNILQVMRGAFNILTDDEKILKNPCSFSLKDVLNIKTNKRVGLDASQQESFMRFVAEHRRIRKYKDEIEVLLHTGIRIGEFCALTKADVDFTHHRLRINKQMVYLHRTLHICAPKSKCGERYVPLNHIAETALRNLMKKKEAQHVEPIVDGVGGFLLVSCRGTARVPQCYNSIFNIIEAEYNKTHTPQIKVTPHILRHTFCTNMIRKNIDPKSLQYIMGHASADLTYNVYADFTYEDAEAGFKRIETLG